MFIHSVILGGGMYENKTCGQGRAVCRLNWVFVVGCIQLAPTALLCNNARADSDEFATVDIRETASVHADSQPLDAQVLGGGELVDTEDKEPVPIAVDADLSESVQLETADLDQTSQLDLVASSDKQSLDVDDTGPGVKLSHPVDDISGYLENQKANVELGDQPELSEAVDVNPVDVALASSDIVQVDTGKADQNSRLDLGGSQDLQSLHVVDAGTSVQFRQEVDGAAGGNGGEETNVEPGGQAMAGLNESIGHDDQRLAASASSNLLMTEVVVDASSRGSDAGKQLNEVSEDIVSEENAGLPYAVVLALLALIGLVPVARRTDHHHV